MNVFGGSRHTALGIISTISYPNVLTKKKKAVEEEVKRLEAEGKPQAAKLYADENKITEQRELEIRAEKNGHSDLNSGRPYLKRTVIEQANKMRRKMHENLKHKAEVGVYGY
ncbi:hypothetical protein [Vibrio harveyi]|uniref:hypothetical protein n=1 Tax=Vibrio harveyi TaxID=669 RepID=UPI00217DFEF4|nr:hypothetical protein [Vibrio harveyi]